MTFRWNSSALLCFGLIGGFASGEGNPVDELPEPLGREHFEALMTRSPFLRTLDLLETYELRGLAQIGSKPVATLYNRATKQSLQVTSEDSADLGMKLVAVNPGTDLKGVSVRISIGGEEVELKYQTERIAPPRKSSKKDSKSNSKGRGEPPKELVKKYYSLNSDQRKTYYRWRETFYKAHPGIKDSAKRFPHVEKAIDAIRAGKPLPKP